MSKESFESEPFLQDSGVERDAVPRWMHLRRPARSNRSVFVLTIICSSLLSILLTWSAQILFASYYGVGTPSSLPRLTVPDFGPVIERFDIDELLIQPPSNGSDEAWRSFIPKGKGFVSLDTLEGMGMDTGYLRDVDVDGNGKFCISAFHQLHCLFMLRHGYYEAIEGRGQVNDHMVHCFDYLRQAIVCSADTALEPYKTEVDGVDGYGAPHQCRDFNALYDWAERYRYIDSEGIY